MTQQKNDCGTLPLAQTTELRSWLQPGSNISIKTEPSGEGVPAASSTLRCRAVN